MNMNEILLVSMIEDKSTSFIHSYKSQIIPQVGDMIPLEKYDYEKYFLVKKRVLPDSDHSDRIVLIGEKYSMSDDCALWI